MDLIFTFENTHFAVKAEKVLLSSNINPRVMPVPSKIKSGCGISLRVNESFLESATKILIENEINSFKVYKIISDSQTNFRNATYILMLEK